jgi:ribosomal protein S18 acetylase RimI-like enzyme
VSRAATSADVDAVAACLASAFHEDPLWGGWAFPRAAERPARLTELMRFWVRGALPHGWVRISRHAEAAAVWLPPGATELSEDEQVAFDAFVERALGARAGEMTELFERFERQHPDDPPHYYLSLWGTHRDSAGRGLGAELIEQCLAQIDAERMPAYLESTNPVNVSRYEALGFAATGEFSAPHGPVVTSMWREPR